MCLYSLFLFRYLPPEVTNLKKLQELDISFNKLKNLPDGIAELSSLKSLNVANNKLVAPPPCISLMSNLERLDLSNNKLTSLTSLRLSSMLTLQHLNLEVHIRHSFKVDHGLSFLLFDIFQKQLRI